MRGGRRLPATAPHLGEDGGLCVCINIPGLNRVASLERLWPSQVGHCEGPPHSYIRMPYGLPNTVATYQRLMRGIMEAQEARRSAALAEMEMVREEPPAPLEPFEAPGLGAHEDRLLQPTESAAPTLTRPQHHQVTSFKFHFQLGAPPGLHYSQAAWVRPCGMYPFYFHVVSLLCWGRPSGCIIPRLLGPGPVMPAFPASI